MINLLQEKLEAVENLRNFTKQILLISIKKDFNEVNNMIENRQKYEEILNLIEEKIKNLELSQSFNEDSVVIKSLKSDIKESIKQTINMDKEIRKYINDELKYIKEKLNEPERNAKLNLKA